MNHPRPLLTILATLIAIVGVLGQARPALAVMYTVDTTSDASLTACTGAAGDCSLRGAINNANASVGVPDTISFNIPPSGTKLITLSGSGYPVIIDGVTIDGTSQPGYNVGAPTPMIEVRGTGLPAGIDGFVISTATPSTIRGIAITGFPDDGVTLLSGAGHTLTGNYIGLQLDGTTANGNGGDGIQNALGSGSHVIGGDTAAERNVVSSNAGIGIKLSNNFTVTGNYVGTDATGTLDRGNGSMGISANDVNNTIGGAGALGNIVSGNTSFGVSLATDGNTVKGNLIGTSATGVAAIPNINGITIQTGADNNTIGGGGVAEGNTISGNSGSGVAVLGGSGNAIKGNQIGTIGGNGDLGNGSVGVYVENATGTIIGGSAAGERNIISGNQSDGVRTGTGGNGTVIKGNYIGLGFNGSTVVANAGEGIDVGAASGTVIGGAAAGEGNVVSSNGADGIQLASTTTGSTIVGNIVGLDATGTLDRGNAGNGILLSTSSSNTIGGTTAGHRNFISGHNNPGFAGIRIEANSNGNAIQGNFIGTDITGAVSIQNTDGVGVYDSDNNDIGGLLASSRNVISGNLDDGIEIAGDSLGTLVRANYIGLNTGGTLDVGNGANGVQQYGTSTGTIIGGVTVGERNVISGNNGTAGIYMINDGNHIRGNYIGLSAVGSTAIGNSQGIYLGGDNNFVGEEAAGTGNVISGNLGDGIELSGTGNLVVRNIIGLDATGVNDRGNGMDGIHISASSNTIGAVGDGNVISGNNSDGIEAANAVTAVVIKANKIGTDVTGTLDRGNSLNGIFLNGADNNTIGGINAVDRNTISGNSSDGIELNFDANSNTIKDNYIGTDVNGVIDLGNSAIGVNIVTSDSNIVGAIDDGNLISGNNQDGVEISTASLSNTVQGNIIGLQSDGVTGRANGTNGIQILGTSNNNTIGGDLSTLMNHIAFNLGDGVTVSSGTGNLISRNSIHDNSALGIDLANDNIVTPNDLDDPDVGANNLQNFPVLTSATSVTNFTNVIGSLNSTPSTSFNLRFFYSDSCDASGNGEGGTYFAGTVVGTNAGGDISFNANLAGVAPSLKWVTVTATATGNHTSEFSNCVQIPALTVDTTSDAILTGCTTAAADCSLRGAITNANAASDADVIQFAIGSGAQTIAPASALPTITAPVAIDGTTQPGFAGLPLITIDGVAAGVVPGFNITIGPSAIKGLAINRFGSHGLVVAGNGTVVSGNHIGINSAGVAALGNSQFGVYIASGFDNVIGGTAVAARNLISGNAVGGIVMNGAENYVLGNYIGTDVTGTLAVGNGGVGILVASADSYVGSAVAGGGNLVSGNNSDGIRVTSQGPGSEIAGNLIGTNVTGTGSLANSGSGVEIEAADTVRIGGLSAATRNVISGNTQDGITVATGANNNNIWGNYIGTNAAGTSSLGNGGDGVNISAASMNNTIGDGTATGRNVISGNLGDGIELVGGGSTGNQVLGNYIGTDVTGALDRGNGDSGIELSGAAGNAIGGAGALGNVISGNNGNGVLAFEGSGNTFESNRIGTAAGSDSALGNGLQGVNLVDSPDNTFGTVLGGNPNRIAHNGFAGIRIDGALSTGNRTIGNAIFSNGGLGIDLTGNVGVTGNDLGDGDAGGNNLQNFPVLVLVGDDLDQALVHGFLNSTPSTTFSLQFYYTAACDGSGNGEGDEIIGSLDVTTASSGNVAFNATASRSGGNFTGGFVTVTATDPAGNTSEFSACKAAIADNDADGDPDALDNCPAWSNPAQALPAWPVPANDPDCDGFNSAVEAFVGTDAADACNTTNASNDEALDAWPTDFNDSRLTSLADVVLMGPVYNQATGTNPAKRRFDLNASGVVSLADVVLMGPLYNKGCS